MSYRDHRFGSQLLGIENCPHCGVASPLLPAVWMSEKPVPNFINEPPSSWAAFACRTCGSVVTAKGTPGDKTRNPLVVEIFPDVWQIDGNVPQRVSNYLSQAHKTLAAPDASVLMSAASIDAMLKDKGLEEGSLYTRIDQAVVDGFLTNTMAEWAHRVRLDANSQRHADGSTPHMTADDAKRAFDFANALIQYLYVLPSKMPPKAE